jgi:hypothetical protein
VLNSLKSVLTLLVCVLLLAIAGCGGGGSSDPAVPTFEDSDQDVLVAEPSGLEIVPEDPLESGLAALDLDFVSSLNAHEFSANALKASKSVAIVGIFADPKSKDGSFTDGHAFITVRNASQSNIKVGALSGIQPNKTMSLGTYGNRREHVGLWYNLEAFQVYTKSSYPDRVSYSYILTQSELDSLNAFILGRDSHTTARNNCTHFAVDAWNGVVARSYRLSNGVLNTPTGLAASIKSTFPSYTKKGSVPFNYVVYYANGKKAPKKSADYVLK